MKSDLLELIKTRRSVRSYLDRPVEREKVGALLEAMRWAPSGGNLQPWAFAVVQENCALREKISALSKYEEWMKEAPVLIAIFYDHTKDSEKIFRCERKHHQAIGSAIQNGMLVAHELGLGTCWIGEILPHESEVKELLSVPDHFELVALLTLGYPSAPPKEKGRYDLKELLLSWD